MENTNGNTLSRDKVLSALCLIIFVLFFIFACMKNTISFGAKLIGTFGIVIYVVLVILSIICLAKFLGLNYKRSVKATAYFLLFLFSLTAVAHSIRTFSILESVSSGVTFNNYINYAYNNLTILGAFGCIICGGISYLIGAMGSIVIFVILATVFIGLFIDYQLYGKYEQKHIKKLHSRKLQEKVVKSDKNISPDGKPNYSFTNQNPKYSDSDVVAEITANYGDVEAEGQEKNYTEDDVVGEITDNQIYDDNQSYYNDNGNYDNSNNNDYSQNPNYYGYQNNNIDYNQQYNTNTGYNNSWNNPFGVDAQKQELNQFTNIAYNHQTSYPNVYDENDERRKFLQATFNTSYNPSDYSPANLGQSTNYDSYDNSSQNYNNFGNSQSDDGRLSKNDMEWKFNDDDFNYQYQYNGVEEKKDNNYNQSQSSNDFNYNSVDDRISEILNNNDDNFESSIKDDFSTNYDLSSNDYNQSDFSTNYSQPAENLNLPEDNFNEISSNNFSTISNIDKSTNDFVSSTSKSNIVIPAKEPEKKASSSAKMGVKSLKYTPPPLSLLNPVIVDNGNYDEEQERKANGLKITLEAFNLPVTVANIVRGPKITRYELSVPLGVSIKKIPNYELDIKSALAAKTINILAPIPGSKYVGIELENDTFTNVSQRELFEADVFKNSTEPLTIAIGKDISGNIVVGSISKMVHLLIAGSTGSGKSVFIHSLIMSLIYKYSPDDVRLVLIDPKKVEFSIYNGLPHLLTPEVVSGTEKAVSALKWCCKEMDRRYALMEMAGYKNIVPYNSSELVKSGQLEKLPYIVVVVDEFAEVIMASKKDAAECIQRLTQLARACGIHLVLATQRPSVDIISGVIKNNVPTRIAFSLSSSFDSKTILDTVGAENLLGRGDMLYKANGTAYIARLQAAYCSDEEIQRVIDFDIKNNTSSYDDAVVSMINAESESNNNSGSGGGGNIPPPKDLDPYFKTAIKIFMQNGSASASYLQRKLQIGYARAARIMDQLENRGYISGASGSKNRNITITPERYKEDFGEDLDLESIDDSGEF